MNFERRSMDLFTNDGIWFHNAYNQSAEFFPDDSTKSMLFQGHLNEFIEVFEANFESSLERAYYA